MTESGEIQKQRGKVALTILKSHYERTAVCHSCMGRARDVTRWTRVMAPFWRAMGWKQSGVALYLSTQLEGAQAGWVVAVVEERNRADRYLPIQIR